MSAWDAEVGSANWGPRDAGAPSSAVGSGYPETKDEGAGVGDTSEGVAAPNWQGAVPSEQANTQGPPSEPSAVVITPAQGGLGGTKGAPNSRRHTMAFEIARVERAGKSTPPNPQKAKHVWDLSRPRYVERTDQIGRRVRVLPGQEHRDAVPYEVWRTSWAQMGDFGLDVGMYFVTMAQLMGAVLVYAALCIVAMIHFSSDQYSTSQVRPRAVCRTLYHPLPPSHGRVFVAVCPLFFRLGHYCYYYYCCASSFPFFCNASSCREPIWSQKTDKTD